MNKYAKTFFTKFEEVQTINGDVLKGEEINGKTFLVIEEKENGSYIIEIDGGIVIQAYKEEVENKYRRNTENILTYDLEG